MRKYCNCNLFYLCVKHLLLTIVNISRSRVSNVFVLEPKYIIISTIQIYKISEESIEPFWRNLETNIVIRLHVDTRRRD